VLLNHEDTNLLEYVPLNHYLEIRKIIIEVVLNTDPCRHFNLLTTLKTKLGNDFPTESLEDRTLILSLTQRLSDNFKMVRGTNTFFRWLENMFDEFYKQGDIEKQLDLPISKFMDRENTQKEKAYASYLNVVCQPLFSTFMILINEDEVSKEIMKEGIEKNKKNLEHKIDNEGVK